MLSQSEARRYARQITLPEIGSAGQERLQAGRVLIVGAGGLGSPAAMYLAAAGVGTLGVVDFDAVDESNLHRQLLHGTSDVGRPKVESARDRLTDINPNVQLETFAVALSSSNAMEIISGFDLVVDGSDNFPTRYLVNDACVVSGIPCVYGSVERFEGQVAVFGAPDGPCYRCLFREPPPPGLVPTCAEAGVFGVLPGLIGTLQATEVIKLLAGVGETLTGRLLIVDAKRMRFRTIEVRRDPECPVCGVRTQTELIDYEAFCGLRPASGTPMRADEIDVEPRALAQRMASGTAPLLVDIRESWETAISQLPGATFIPMGDIAAGTAELPRDREVVLYCRSGARSGRLMEALRARGYDRLRHLRGGIEAWRTEVDPSIPRY